MPGVLDSTRTLRPLWNTQGIRSEGMRPSYISPHRTRVDMGYSADIEVPWSSPPESSSSHSSQKTA